jgi:hypothetical protein
MLDENRDFVKIHSEGNRKNHLMQLSAFFEHVENAEKFREIIPESEENLKNAKSEYVKARKIARSLPGNIRLYKIVQARIASISDRQITSAFVDKMKSAGESYTGLIDALKGGDWQGARSHLEKIDPDLMQYLDPEKKGELDRISRFFGHIDHADELSGKPETVEILEAVIATCEEAIAVARTSAFFDSLEPPLSERIAHTEERRNELIGAEKIEDVEREGRERIKAKTVVKKDDRFTLYDDGTVLDAETNLMWAAEDNGEDIDWKWAERYCLVFTGGGYTDWRLPTINELRSLYDENKPWRDTDCGSVRTATEWIRFSCTWFWSSESKFSSPDAFNFRNGDVDRNHMGNFYDDRVMPVRVGN